MMTRGNAHLVLAVITLFKNTDIESSNFHLDEALRLRPQDYFVLSSAGGFYVNSGRVEEGLSLLRRSIDINPADGAAVWFYSGFLDNLQMFDEAIEAGQHVVALMPDIAFGYTNLAIIAARAGKNEMARDAIGKAMARQPNFIEMADIALAHSYLGDTQGAQEIVSELRVAHGDLPILSFQAKLHLAVEEYEQVIDLIEQNLDDPLHGSIRTSLYQDSGPREFHEIRHLPRYRALVARVRAEVDGAR